MAKATLILDFKAVQRDLLVQMVLWQLPRATKDRPHGIKYRLYLGRAGGTLVRYDNETGKGNHRHAGLDEVQAAYVFSSVEQLLSNFRAECEQFGWRWGE